MSRINTNVSALLAQHNLQRSNTDLATSLERLSTGLAINRAADNPAGLIVSERLRNEIAGVNQSVSNIERASNVIATAEAALQEVSTLLTSVKGLAVEAANTGGFSKEEIEANQLQIDSAIQSITRISNSTSFAGLKLLNGSLDYVLSGVDNSQITDVKVYGANFGTRSWLPVNVEVLNSAQNAQLFISGDMAGSPGALLSSVSLEITGKNGVEMFSFASGTALSAMVFAVNQLKDATGVSASLVNAADQTSGVVLTSAEFGSDAFVSVRKVSGGATFQTYDAQNGNAIARDEGEDVLALVNGNLALGNGTHVSVNTTTLNMALDLTATAAQQLGTYTFSITGGGANYQVGPSVNSSQQIGFGLSSASAAHLGNSVLGYLTSVQSGGDNSLIAGRAREASQIIDEAIDQVAVQRGRMDALERNTLETAARSQQIALENLTSAESSIRDSDFAAETSQMTRSQILVSAGTSVLSLANHSAQNVLQLLQ